MEYLFTTLLDDPSEVCMWAKKDVEKAYRKSCSEAIRDIAHNIAKRNKLNDEAEVLAKELIRAHDNKDTHLVSDILSLIKKNIEGSLRQLERAMEWRGRL